MSYELLERLENTEKLLEHRCREVDQLRDQLAAAQAREAELMADNARLRGTMNDLLMLPDKHPGHRNLMTMEIITKALAATPEQSLARIRNQRVEDVAVMVKNDGWLHLAEAIRAMKEPE